ncbi:MAG: ribosome small subunit-dependent GTPase A [Candidatus Hydrogenedentota bacterium]
MTELEKLGWSDAFEKKFRDAAATITDAIPARIVREDRGLYRAIAAGQNTPAEITGAYRHDHVRSEDFPAVGDWVVANQIHGEEKLRIHALLPRRTAFSRTAAGTTSEKQVVAANVDTVFIVMGLDGDFNVRRVERYVSLAYESGAQPVIVLNKSDLAESPAQRKSETEDVAMGVPVYLVASLSGEGIEALRPFVSVGQTVACLGSSGAGKSTLINALLGEDTMATGAIREDDSRGRHTTTHRQLLRLPGGGSLIDTPGMRELQLTGDEGGLDSAFKDVETLAENCAFRDCTHGNEPGCAIRMALDSGELDPARYRSYEKLQRELDYAQRRQSESLNYQEQQRTKAKGKIHKRIQNEKRRR